MTKPQNPSSSEMVGAKGRHGAARHIAVSLRTLDNLAATGQLKKIKIGRKTVFRVADLDAFLLLKLEETN